MPEHQMQVLSPVESVQLKVFSAEVGSVGPSLFDTSMLGPQNKPNIL